jgi:hypothetical protein
MAFAFWDMIQPRIVHDWHPKPARSKPGTEKMRMRMDRSDFVSRAITKVRFTEIGRWNRLRTNRELKAHGNVEVQVRVESGEPPAAAAVQRAVKYICHCLPSASQQRCGFVEDGR